MIPVNERIIFALDFKDKKEALLWVKKLDSKVKFFKVGLQLFLSAWWEDLVSEIVDRGNKVMADLKFFDIPETVGLATEKLTNKGISFATIHGNNSIIQSAVKNKGDLKILSVTVLTSFDESDMKEMGFTKKVSDLVLIRAKKSLELGCDGVVCSPLEIPILRQNFGNKFLIVSPGIRPEFLNSQIEKDDQRRIASPKEAIKNGADYLVIGRPISKSANPLLAVSKIYEEIENEINN